MPAGQRPNPQGLTSAPKQPMPMVNTPTPPPRPAEVAGADAAAASAAAAAAAAARLGAAAVTSAPPPQARRRRTPRRAPPVAGAGRRAEVVQRRRRALRRRRHARALAHPEGQARLRPLHHEGSALADRERQDPAASTSSSTPRTASASKVQDHPQLRQLVWRPRRASASRSASTQRTHERSKFRGRMVTIFALVGLVVLGARRRRLLVRQEARRLRDQGRQRGRARRRVRLHEGRRDLDEGRPAGAQEARVRRAATSSKNGKNGEFSDVTNLGDASEGGGDETLDQAVVQRVMTQNFSVLVGCIAEERRRNSSLHAVDMDFIIKGTGQVSAVKVNGQTSSPMAVVHVRQDAVGRVPQVQRRQDARLVLAGPQVTSCAFAIGPRRERGSASP